MQWTMQWGWATNGDGFFCVAGTWCEELSRCLAQVLLLTSLIKEVTGIRCHAFFAPKAGQAAQGMPWERLGGFGHELRRMSIRWELNSCRCGSQVSRCP
jgi:hypothetical protein